jgi:hypothetical protein
LALSKIIPVQILCVFRSIVLPSKADLPVVAEPAPWLNLLPYLGLFWGELALKKAPCNIDFSSHWKIQPSIEFVSSSLMPCLFIEKKEKYFTGLNMFKNSLFKLLSMPACVSFTSH